MGNVGVEVPPGASSSSSRVVLSYISGNCRRNNMAGTSGAPELISRGNSVHPCRGVAAHASVTGMRCNWPPEWRPVGTLVSTRAVFRCALHGRGRCSKDRKEFITWDLCSRASSLSCLVECYPISRSAAGTCTRTVLRGAFVRKFRQCRTVLHVELLNLCWLS